MHMFKTKQGRGLTIFLNLQDSVQNSYPVWKDLGLFDNACELFIHPVNFYVRVSN